MLGIPYGGGLTEEEGLMCREKNKKVMNGKSCQSEPISEIKGLGERQRQSHSF